MAKKKQVYMPSGFAGLMRFGEESKQFIKLKPESRALDVATKLGMV